MQQYSQVCISVYVPKAPPPPPIAAPVFAATRVRHTCRIFVCAYLAFHLLPRVVQRRRPQEKLQRCRWLTVGSPGCGAVWCIAGGGLWSSPPPRPPPRPWTVWSTQLPPRCRARDRTEAARDRSVPGFCFKTYSRLAVLRKRCPNIEIASIF
jgi:hypothetical protein